MPRLLRSALLAASFVCACAGAPALAASPVVSMLYDTEFGGYVPVVGGIERPDLVVKEGDGRVPVKTHWWTKWLVRRAAAANRLPEVPVLRTASLAALEAATDPPKMSGRWLHRTAIRTEFLVLDGDGHPVEGARVYAFTDPSFYPVNQDDHGARLFATWRFMPRSFPGTTAQSLAGALDPLWTLTGDAPVRADADIDALDNPWIRSAFAPEPPVELVGRTNAAGMLGVMNGAFNLRDRKKFPRAVVPEALQIGYVVVADGFLPGVTTARFTAGGTHDTRTVQLLSAPNGPLLRSGEFRSALALVDALPLESEANVAAEIEKLGETLVVALVEVPKEAREAARADAVARLWERLAYRARPPWPERIARRVLELAPTPARQARLAMLLATRIGVTPGTPVPKRAEPPGPELEEAETLFIGAIEAEPRLLPAYRWLDALLVRRGAADAVRRPWTARLLQAEAFDAWGRARMATFQLRAGRDAEAFDNLRFTYTAFPGLGGDRELARAMSAHYWKIGLPEKAGAYAWLLTGRVPEDPTVPPRKP